jgi:formylglycine-generating enzyme required for sulfatase activity
MLDVRTDRDAVEQARSALAVDGREVLKCRDAEVVYRSLRVLLGALGPADTCEVLADGFLRHADDRYSQHVAPHMVDLGAATFVMGTAPAHRRHFCGEVPDHRVDLSPFQLADATVTNELYGLLFPGRQPTARRDRHKPVVGATWHEAAILALWVGCRLPTEAEWEFGCGAGTEGQWCCSDEAELDRYAWYCRNSDGGVHDVRTRAPNALGLYDMHGNVWEWCADTYEHDYYGRSARRDPLNLGSPVSSASPAEVHKVCRGGSMQSLSEMCRTRFRFHDPVDFWALDLGFRLARSRQPDIEESFAWLC